MKRNLNLLRPFDLEAAKRGVPLTQDDYLLGEPTWKYACGPDTNGRIMATIISSGGFIAEPTHTKVFKMAPLAWVDGKPVYEGDTLYWKSCDGWYYTFEAGSVGIIHGDLLQGVSTSPEYVMGKDGKSGVPIESLEWETPHKEYWVNMYSKFSGVPMPETKHNSSGELIVVTYPDKLSAELNVRDSRTEHYTGCVKFYA